MMPTMPEYPKSAGKVLSRETGLTINKNTLLLEPTAQQARLFNKAVEAVRPLADEATEAAEKVGAETIAAAQTAAVQAASSQTNKLLVGAAVIAGALILLSR